MSYEPHDDDWDSEMSQAITSASQPVLGEGGSENHRHRFARKSGSFSASVMDLEPGECASKVQQVDPGMTVGDFAAQMSGLKGTMVNNAASAVSQAKRKTGGTYKSSVSETLTPGGQLFLVLIIQRLG